MRITVVTLLFFYCLGSLSPPGQDKKGGTKKERERARDVHTETNTPCSQDTPSHSFETLSSFRKEHKNFDIESKK